MRDLESLDNVVPWVDRWEIAPADRFVHCHVIAQWANVMRIRCVRVWMASKALHAPAVWKLFLNLGFAYTSEINSDDGPYAIERSLPAGSRSLSGPDGSFVTYRFRLVS